MSTSDDTNRNDATAPGTIAQRLQATASRLTKAERKIANTLDRDPQSVAFGTVAELAAVAGTSGATVVRLASKLGFDGFTGLQTAVQTEIDRRLRPAIERIYDPEPDDLVSQASNAAVTAVRSTLESVSLLQLSEIIELLGADSSRVWVIAGDAASGIAHQFVKELSMIRPSVGLVSGSPVHVARLLADITRGDVLVAIDLPRYDRWVVEATTHAVESGVTLIALTDGPLSPLAQGAAQVLAMDATGVGPFDNYVGALALLSTITAGVAHHLTKPAAAHLQRIEAAWKASATFVDPDSESRHHE